MKEVIAGVDIGGTFTKFGLVTSEGKLLVKNAIKTNSRISYNLFFKQLYDEITDLVGQVGPGFKLAGIGIGAPNGNCLTGYIDDASNLLWPDKIPVVDIMEMLSDLPVALSNDANAAAIGELLFGAAKGLRNFAVITIGTGLGSGIVVDGDLLLGREGHAGELGHTTVYYDGRLCTCGRKGCLETYVSASGIVTTVKELLEKSENKESILHSKNHLNSKMVTSAALKGDKLALEAFEYTGRILGLKLADTVAHLNPEAFIITGGLANAGHLLFDPARKYMEEHLLSVYRGSVRLLSSQISEKNAAILGTAALMWKQLSTRRIENEDSAPELKVTGN